jgi:Ca2+/Na+ antiporter
METPKGRIDKIVWLFLNVPLLGAFAVISFVIALPPTIIYLTGFVVWALWMHKPSSFVLRHGFKSTLLNASNPVSGFVFFFLLFVIWRDSTGLLIPLYYYLCVCFIYILTFLMADHSDEDIRELLSVVFPPWKEAPKSNNP